MWNATAPRIGPETGERDLPRYASYPTSARFRPGIGDAEIDLWLAALPAGARLALHLHIPFCERICRFCCCRTQGAATPARIARYVAALAGEIARTGARIPGDALVVAVHWQGGSPTTLAPRQVAALDRALRSAFRVAPDARVLVEIEPEGTTAPRLAALAAAGLRLASVGLQDFAPRVQQAIGRAFGPDVVAATFARLRAAGAAIAVDLLYGLPEQTATSAAATAASVAWLAPDRVVLTAYAHVPWIAKRQHMVPLAAIPDAASRLEQFAAAADRLAAAGYVACGVDQFALPGDPLALAAAAGRLRRDLLGYAEAPVDAVIGFGPAAISRLPNGAAQNAAGTGAYVARIEAGRTAAVRGLPLGLEDRVRGRAIEMLFCDRRVDLARLRNEFGDFAALAEPACARAAARFPAVRRVADGIVLDEPGPIAARRVARLFDAYAEDEPRPAP